MKNMKNIIFLSLVLVLVLVLLITVGRGYGMVSVFVHEGDIEWVDPQDKTLSLAENITRENFIIEATDFYESSALLTVTSKNEEVEKAIVRKGDYFNIVDKTNITIMNVTILDYKEKKGNLSAQEGLNITIDQRIKIRTRLVGQPVPRLSIIPWERKRNNRTFVDRVFVGGSEISINFSIKNEGKSTLRGMHLVLNKSGIMGVEMGGLGFLFSNERLDRELPQLKANETVTENIRFRAPTVTKRKNFTISAKVVGKDAFGREYNTSDSTYVIVRPLFEKLVDIKKYIPEKMYMGDYLYVSVYIKNNGYDDINGMNLIEDIPAGFIPLDIFYYNNLTNFTLKGNENKLVMYKLKPMRPGIFIFGNKSSILKWGKDGEEKIEYNNDANRLIVNGPYVEIRKTGVIDDKGRNKKGSDKITVNIIARNLGDMTAIVKFRDAVPMNGVIAKTLVIRPSDTAAYTYSIDKSNVTNIISNGKVTLPHVKATVVDQFLYTNDRYAQHVVSNDLVLNLSER